jgi:hypothetical protein
MAHYPIIDFFVTAAPTGIPVNFQAELDCEGEDETEINTKIAAARADLIDKYNIEEV